MSVSTFSGSEASPLSGGLSEATESARDARSLLADPAQQPRPEAVPSMPTGQVRFLDEAGVLELFRDAERAGLLPVTVPAARACDRGKLALVLEEAVEVALERRGACPPGIGAASDLDASLSDQLYRARLIELRGLCLAVGPLEAIATLSGALDAEDSAVLRFWLDATRARPLELALDARNRSLAVYGPPVELAQLIRGAAAPVLELTPSVSPEVAASAATMELSEPPPPVIVNVAPVEPVEAAPVEAAPVEAAPIEEKPESEPISRVENVSDPQVGHAVEAGNEPSLAGDLAQALVAELTAETPVSQVAETPGETADALIASEASDTPQTPSVEAALPHAAVDSAPESAERVVLAEVEEAPTTERRPPLHPDAATEWKTWLAEIERARGPKPLGAVERMFVSAYVPLRDAYLRGLTPPEVGAVLEGWAASFAKSYTDAFDALRVRGKRPTMVLDVPDTAHRIGRLHGARSVQLLLVDGMRYDLGLRVEQLLRERLGREVALTERLLLWSALPSDSATQLELIGRGPDGLRDFGGPPESEIPVARGRMATTPRRIKAGHRELLKLDVVEARLSEPGPREAERLDALAGEVTEAIAELCEKLPARTLLMVFGDHGFLLDPQGNGTGAARQGGARPEQVLVPAFAWLVGGVQ